jgi:hypothetical protein
MSINIVSHIQSARNEERKMTQNNLLAEERAARGKRLLLYGMFSLVVVTVVAVFVSMWLVMAPLGMTGVVIRTTLIIGAIAIVACVIIWFVYTKVVLKE